MRAVQRAVRTFFQSAIGVFVSLWVASGVDLATTDLSTVRRIGLSALSAGVVSLLTFIHNALEDGGTVPKILKD